MKMFKYCGFYYKQNIHVLDNRVYLQENVS